MRRLWSALLLAGGLLMLGSLYLPWQEASCQSAHCVAVLSALISVDGWSSGAGEATGLVALLLTAVAAIALVRPKLADRLPLGVCALLSGYFALAVGAEARSDAHHRELILKTIQTVHFHYSYAAYLGAAGGIVAVLAAGATRREELVRYRADLRLAGLVLVVGLLVAFLLPWQRFAFSKGVVTFLGIASPAAVVAAAVTLGLAVAWWRADSTRVVERFGIGSVAALLTGAAVSSVLLGTTHVYGAWVGLGLAVALVAFGALGLLDGAHISRPARPSSYALAVGAAGALLVTGLFLPWQEVCYPTGGGFGRYSGRCISTNGWVGTAGSAAGLLAMTLVVLILARRRPAASAVELAAGVGLLVSAMGFQLAEADGSGLGFRFGYGSIVGFTGTALLIVLALVRARPPKFERNRLIVRLAPVAACLSYLVIVVLPWWDVLPHQLQSSIRFAPLSWLTIGGALVGIHLLGLWARRIAATPPGVDSLVLLPLALLGVAALDLIRLRGDGITWGGGIVVGLCVLLALLGHIEQREGLENLRVPELLRIDRL